MQRAPVPRITFITGTDTGVGKTVLTALLLSHLRQSGWSTLAIKPFCTGGRGDGELLHALQNNDLSIDQINPFYFPEPVAPLVAARDRNRQIRMDDVLGNIRSVLKRLSAIENRKSKIENPTLLIEGAGGLLAPLGERCNLLQLILALAPELAPKSSIQVIVVAPNRLGAINHTLLTIHALKAQNLGQIKMVLMDCDSRSQSRITHHASRSNHSLLTELLPNIPLFHVQNLGKNPSKPERIRTFAKKYKKTLAKILA